MSTAAEILGAIKKILLVSEDLERQKASIEKLSQQVSEHEHRLIRIETAMEMASRPRRLIVSGE